MTITDKTRFEPLRLGLAISRLLARAYVEQWEATAYMRLLGNIKTLDEIRNARPLADILTSIDADVVAFRKRRAPFLLYD
jgi:uncharacterized protein YbbC (DUF1343 family)